MNRRFSGTVALAATLGAIYLAVLPMASTIALRNLALAGLLIVLLLSFRDLRDDMPWSWPVVLWLGYLLVFPLIADDRLQAWQNLTGQWGRVLLAMVAGAGLAILLRRQGQGSAMQLGVLSAVPILVHLTLLGWQFIQSGSVPWGSWGRETHHADLGYAAGHAVILLSAAFVAGDSRLRPVALVLILAALLSTVLARSRAGFAFAVLGSLLVLGQAFWLSSRERRRNVILALLGLMVVGSAIFTLATRNDPRWRNMTDQLSAGMLGDELLIACKGVSTIEEEIRHRYSEAGRVSEILASVQGGDGARVVALRVGMHLVLSHPWGSDGSRFAFQHLLAEECPAPAMPLLHAHNGWIDMTLAIGWGGALLYLGMLAYFFQQGRANLRGSSTTGTRVWALVLTSVVAFWVLRGLTDSVYRDHMLEMQGLILAYAYTALKLGQGRKRSDSSQDATKPATQS